MERVFARDSGASFAHGSGAGFSLKVVEQHLLRYNRVVVTRQQQADQFTSTCGASFSLMMVERVFAQGSGAGFAQGSGATFAQVTTEW